MLKDFPEMNPGVIKCTFLMKVWEFLGFLFQAGDAWVFIYVLI
jgi:hypothetical protein